MDPEFESSLIQIKCEIIVGHHPEPVLVPVIHGRCFKGWIDDDIWIEIIIVPLCANN